MRCCGRVAVLDFVRLLQRLGGADAEEEESSRDKGKQRRGEPPPMLPAMFVRPGSELVDVSVTDLNEAEGGTGSRFSLGWQQWRGRRMGM